MPRRTGSSFITVLAVTLCSVPAQAALDSKLRVDIVHGYDSSPLELHEGSEAGPYTDLSFGGTMALQWSRGAGAFLRAGGTGRYYASSVSDADRVSGDMEIGLAFIPYRRGERRLSLALGGRYGLFRSTFVDPATGEAYVVTPDPNTSVAVPGRFDYDSTAAFLDLRWRVQGRVLLILDTEAGRRRFVEDYARTTGLEALDDRSTTLGPGVRLDLSDAVGLEISYEWTDRRFDELDALDEDGGVVAGTRRRYRYGAGRLALSLEPSKRWKLRTGLQRTGQSDLFEGYYDSTGTVTYASAEFSAGRSLRFGLDVSQRGSRYANATVDSVSGGVRRRGSTLRAAGRAERDLGDHFSVLVEAGVDRADDRDPLYQYDRNWAHAGVRVKL